MRINGTYIERLFVVILPLMIAGILIVWLLAGVTKINLNELVFVCTLIACFFWLIDSIWIATKKVKSLILDNGIYFGGELIAVTSIIKIVPFNNGTTRWEIEMLEFTLSDSRVIYVLDKPYPIYKPFLKNTGSKTLALLIKYYPGLKSRIRVTRSG
ncbi:hypothetical protein [Lacibacter sp.]|uniref:hypothetical protein n=1 Tax=Lacibacter sp. TaxID=1915409 RepID=UPI002B4B6552|nr:hypothetical protein [Lacibacter sp.]HLP38086.1 hypothetical protein [Lacibacter sp.]